MSAKTPFEIRLEVLQMAKEFLDKQAEIQLDFAVASFAELVKFGKKTAEQWQEFAPVPYTIKELTDKANELYGFILKTK